MCELKIEFSIISEDKSDFKTLKSDLKFELFSLWVKGDTIRGELKYKESVLMYTEACRGLDFDSLIPRVQNVIIDPLSVAKVCESHNYDVKIDFVIRGVKDIFPSITLPFEFISFCSEIGASIDVDVSL